MSVGRQAEAPRRPRWWQTSVRLGVAVLGLGLGVGCGGDDERAGYEGLERLMVRFEYRAPTTFNSDLLANARACVELVGRTHIHPSWESFNPTFMRIEGADLWSAEFDDVPVGRRRIRVSDANACVDNNTGAVVDHAVYANGVLLTEQVNTPGSGVEPGFAFDLLPDGAIVP